MAMKTWGCWSNGHSLLCFFLFSSSSSLVFLFVLVFLRFCVCLSFSVMYVFLSLFSFFLSSSFLSRSHGFCLVLLLLCLYVFFFLRFCVCLSFSIMYVFLSLFSFFVFLISVSCASSSLSFVFVSTVIFSWNALFMVQLLLKMELWSCYWRRSRGRAAGIQRSHLLFLSAVCSPPLCLWPFSGFYKTSECHVVAPPDNEATLQDCYCSSNGNGIRRCIVVAGGAVGREPFFCCWIRGMKIMNSVFKTGPFSQLK
jgi:hypothetical protein